jgi:orotate phosphoribosyltransferase
VVNRQEGGEQRLADLGVGLRSLVTAEELLK